MGDDNKRYTASSAAAFHVVFFAFALLFGMMSMYAITYDVWYGDFATKLVTAGFFMLVLAAGYGMRVSELDYYKLKEQAK